MSNAEKIQAILGVQSKATRKTVSMPKVKTKSKTKVILIKAKDRR